jgi:cytochrome c oxidase subunit 1
MEHTLTHGTATGEHPKPEKNYLNETTGIWSWMTTVDHKRIGIMYLVAVSVAFGIGGTFALLVRLALLNPQHTLFGKHWVDAEMYNRFFTLHGVVMVFLFIIPSIPASLANFVLPLMLGAKDVAFPRLNLMSFYLWVIGAVLAVSAMIAGGVDTGWTFYTPYSTTTNTHVTVMLMAAFVLGFSSIFTGLNFIATTHKLRAPGMGWFDMPLFVWGIYATAIIQILATPVLAITLVLLMIERNFQIGIFDSRIGGDPVLFQHFFWFYSHPAVYIMILPGMAIMSEIVPTFCRKTIFGYKAIAYSSISLALLSFLVWGHHMFVAGESDLANVVFSGLTFLVALPSGVKVFNWISTMYKGNISFETPMLYALNFLILFTIGGLTGIFFATLAVDVHLTDTYWVVAHFHYVMMGGTAIAFFGGLHYWWPKMTGKMYNERWGQLSAILVFIGFNVTFMSQFIMGGRGMPRRYFNYLDQFAPMHMYSTIGSWILAVAFVIMAMNLLASLKFGAKALPNPWGGTTMEWETDSPPITHNFHEQPVLVHEPYDYRHREVTHV